MALVFTILLLAITASVLVAAWRMSRTPAAPARPVLTGQEISALARCGFFVHVSPAEHARVRTAVARTRWPFWVDGTQRLLHCDAEQLSKGGVAQFLDELRPMLALRGVDLGAIENRWHVDYRVTCGGREQLIWSAAEAARERDTEQPGLVWGLTTARAFAMVNRLLRDSGSPERLYAVGAGNNLLAYLLTPELAELVSGLTGTSPSEVPYLPTEEFPRFGRPHG